MERGGFGQRGGMVKAADIRDAQTLADWLQWQSRDVVAWVAHRSAMRLVPLGWRFSAEIKGRGIPTSLAMLRANLTTMVSIKRGEDRVSSALDWCVRYCDEAASSTAHHSQAGTTLATCAFIAARDAAALLTSPGKTENRATRVVLAFVEGWVVPGLNLQKQIGPAIVEAGDAPWQIVRWDCEMSERGRGHTDLPLWESSNPLSRMWVNHQNQQNNDGGREFWINWYEDALAGREPDWGRLREIALIPDDIWEQGAEAVNARIESLSRGRSGSDAEDLHSDSKNWAITDRLARNAKVVALQLDTLRTFVAEEIERMRGQNSLPGEEHEALSARLVNLALIVEAVDLMREAIEEDEAGASTALVVVEAKLPQIVEAAEEAVELGGEPQVSATIVTMAASIRALTEAGTPGREATAIALADFCVNAIKRVFKRG